MPTDYPGIFPEVRLVRLGETHHLCGCGRCVGLPDSGANCPRVVILRPRREQRVLLCRCGRSAELPYCDGRHGAPAPRLADKWRRFFGAE
ncbi:CDGSH iron-sulfur domain-containing protein [Pseudomonas sp. NCCP-436]|uniref:CDGSH iron-sulfur domain-containing protein n=1 Tax=Pseudomonas sp. NCCP-436 TaxID=2842481 RepID=UPI001C7E53F2|nr:CDGSH iron-sulfur domain-containing protein [Pseudomonas sp. NCCP-436]